MSTTLKDQAVCIARRTYSETSQILTLFGRTQGRIRAIAKGARRAKSKFGGGVDLLTAGAILFQAPAGEGSLALLLEFDVTDTFAGLREDLLTLNAAQYAGELISLFTEDYDPHESLYDAFCGFLHRLVETDTPLLALVQFELVLLCEVGLGPVWNACCHCGADLPTTTQIYFSSSSGGMLCRQCEPAVMEKRFIRPAVLQFLQRPGSTQNANPAVIAQAHELLSYHQRELIGKETPTMAFLNRLLKQHRATP